MNFLPKVIENIILDYKYQLEVTDKFDLLKSELLSKVSPDIFTRNYPHSEIFEFRHEIKFNKNRRVSYWYVIHKRDDAGINKYGKLDKNRNLSRIIVTNNSKKFIALDGIDLPYITDL